MNRRRWLAWGCGHCALALGSGLGAASAAGAQALPADWSLPKRFTRPEDSTDEGGLWAMMDREETRLRRSAQVMRQGPLKAYLQDIMCRLGGEHCADVRVYPVRTPWFNATMAPNGMMQVWSGLLLRVDNEAQLAAVLGHELGHYLQRHSIEQLRDIRTRSAFGQLLGVALGGVGLIAQLALLAGAAAHTRDHERQADAMGLTLMVNAGYDPRAAAEVWRNMRLELSAGAGGDPGRRSVLFASHPPSEEREQSLQRMAEAMLADGKLKAVTTHAAAYHAAIEPYLPDLFEDELRRGQYDETIVLLDRWVGRDASRGDWLYVRGEARRLRDQGEDHLLARRDLEQATVVQRPAPQAWRSLGFIQQKRGEADLSRQSFKQYLTLMPDAPDAGLIQTYI